ncbi:hypothetical protein [Phytohabitans rumicis]|uniref:Uncharacterized protein n=1 Tax=Phytohabitans rumicis TaxID=1076125 RepID=A0A6V8LJC4_9ACTN|nr:hypothetical protein [Phytohabitans rumicis]GFJ94167.1 hypothetical protein Prum_078090 [Phytohabitans rumicis]
MLPRLSTTPLNVALYGLALCLAGVAASLATGGLATLATAGAALTGDPLALLSATLHQVAAIDPRLVACPTVMNM